MSGNRQTRCLPVTPRESADHLAQPPVDTPAQRLIPTAGIASAQDPVCSDTLESLYRHQQQLEVRQKLENEKITRLLSDITALDKKISELQETHGCDLKPCFEHIRQTCLSECISMMTIIRSAPTVDVEALPNVHATARDLAVRRTHTTSVQGNTTEIQPKQRQQPTEPNSRAGARSSRFFVHRSSVGGASASRRTDPIEDASSDAAAIGEDSPMPDHSGTATLESVGAIYEHGDTEESDYSG
jgi:hypothetical protein